MNNKCKYKKAWQKEEQPFDNADFSENWHLIAKL